MGAPSINTNHEVGYHPFTWLLQKIQMHEEIEIGSGTNGLNGADQYGNVGSNCDTVELSTQHTEPTTSKPNTTNTQKTQNTNPQNIKNNYEVSYTVSTNPVENSDGMYENIATFSFKGQDGQSHKINISVDSDLNGDYLKNLENAFNNTPDEIINIMIKENINNIKIKNPLYKNINGGRTTDLYTYGQYFGDTNSITFYYGKNGGKDFNNNVINGINAKNLTHEVAHAVDFQKGAFASVVDDKTKTEMESNFDELTKFLNESNINTDNLKLYCLDNPMEFFAEYLTDKAGFESSYTILKNSIKDIQNEAKINEIIKNLETNCENIIVNADFNKTNGVMDKELQQLEEYAQKNSDYELNHVRGTSEWILGKIETNSENPSMDILKELYKNKYLQQDSEIISKIEDFIKNNPQFESIWKNINIYLDAPCKEFINTNKN